ncbi:DUF4234 domain-containing protein [Mumia sp. DW29H23]|uniref:DUF4234 domain-containing protein n=1 Tax=Mumia sp. DW29H23 TaxID=3421241 RepID=UPI003D68F5C5
MTDPTVPPAPAEPNDIANTLAPEARPLQAAPTPAADAAPYAPGVPQAYAPGSGPVGKVRSTGVCILLAIVTLGIYTLVWWYKTHAEMKRHSGTGLGGGIALLLAFFVSIVMPYITSSEVGGLYERRGQAKPVSGATGLWYFPGMFILVGPFVWFIKTNGALNAYWRSLGAR